MFGKLKRKTDLGKVRGSILLPEPGSIRLLTQLCISFVWTLLLNQPSSVGIGMSTAASDIMSSHGHI